MPETNEYTDDPIIIIDKIRYERELRNKTIKSYLDELKIILFSGADSKASVLQRNINFNTTYSDLRICKDMKEILDKIMEMMGKYQDIENIDSNSFNMLYEYSRQKMTEYQEFMKRYEGIEKEMQKKENQLQNKEDEIQTLNETATERIAIQAGDLQSFLTERSKKDVPTKDMIKKIQQHRPDIWEELNQLHKPKIKEKLDIKIDETTLPNINKSEWEMIKKWEYLLNQGYSEDGLKLAGVDTAGFILRINPNTVRSILKMYRQMSGNPHFRAKLDAIEVIDEDFYDRAKKVKEGRMKVGMDDGANIPRKEDFGNEREEVEE